MERGLGRLQRGRRVATRNDQYAHHFLGFLYLAAAWIWLIDHRVSNKVQRYLILEDLQSSRYIKFQCLYQI